MQVIHNLAKQILLALRESLALFFDTKHHTLK